MNMEVEILKPGDWVKTYADYLYSLALIKVSNKETAEDLVQETFLSAFKAKDSFKNGSSEKTWLTAILKNKIIDHYRKKDILKDVSSYISETNKGFDEHFFDTHNGHWLMESAPLAWKELADAKVNLNEFNKIIQYCIQKMPTKLVPVFVAKFLDEAESDLICKEFNITPSNYWVIIHRAKVLIRSCLEKNWFLS
ncbi:sigma-70 family RNA polymerase sigma factor [Ferruginibacter paludis]|uniref:sigma-70 family RNA polymerase sigma factor n=1 Tax=Ferruginibacter paludis TaxID=1310417 RepID=UPI0025B5FB58|nr:sigma-70 family RNA polymerase sigma factor [Ferruginibacter paludis]MDN3654836.1 sigma-70 family RNA polymerase sigma factor [Ferruginibacter paludis]